MSYTILTTYPEQGSGNVGDKLITKSAIDILKKEKEEDDFTVFFREENLAPHLDKINATDAVFMPGFAIRDPMYPDTYRLMDDLGKIEPPLIPLGAGWKGFPGDWRHLHQFDYSDQTKEFLRHIADQIEVFACREYYTCRLMRRIGIENVMMVGDCAWYDIESLGQPMKRPSSIDRLVFTTPHATRYAEQAKEMLSMLDSLFPSAEKICSFQSEIGTHPHEHDTAEHADKHGFNVRDTSHNTDHLALYEKSDLHVGYRVHGHIAFLRKRIPSVLISEDGRGAGFTYTFGRGGMKGFPSHLSTRMSAADTWLDRMSEGLGWRLVEDAFGRRPSLAYSIRCFLEEELESQFRRYVGIGRTIDETYEENMSEFVKIVQQKTVQWIRIG